MPYSHPVSMDASPWLILTQQSGGPRGPGSLQAGAQRTNEGAGKEGIAPASPFRLRPRPLGTL
ncbi:hypothetical protein U0070_005612 [Myodes glareolus]|uniref:Uncharacterized protein n=1 Tax=Myodes glareolus TaxID=447135 RepID=A0AAW0IM23_MYOGA